jgi:hypothetical protein
MFFPDDAVRVAALSEHVGRWVATEAYAAHVQRRPTRGQFASSERTRRLSFSRSGNKSYLCPMANWWRE